ncbi:unnamed protein product [Pedinophyceae sp. YPF-701]|nr:unnamed protein product [Pedinophyceae sp. YPF-701]
MVAAKLREMDEALVASLSRKLVEPGHDLPLRYQALWTLRNASNAAATEALVAALNAHELGNLFRHDVAFALGQRQDATAVSALKRVLLNEQDHPMVRHEAGEALGAIGGDECLSLVKRCASDPQREVRETCELALQRLDFFAAHGGDGPSEAARDGGPDADASAQESPYLSVDPTPALPASTPFPELAALLADEEAPLFRRYRALFALRNRGGPQAAQAIGETLLASSSALLKHEIAYVLGQMARKDSVDALAASLGNAEEHAMVRHEAAEALGAVADDRCVGLLRKFAADPEPIVADSCLVALDALGKELAGEDYFAVEGAAQVAAASAH